LSLFAVLNVSDSQLCFLSFVLGDNNLNGTLPSELGLLRNLRKELWLGKFFELVFHLSLLEFVWAFVVLLEVGLNRF